MHLISKLEVDGFWDTHKVSVSLRPDVTIFIGVNGSGKTTLINMLAAALMADFPTLSKLPFRKITITLASVDGGAGPTVIVSKSQKKDRSIEFIEYRIRRAGGGAEERYSLDEREEVLWARRSAVNPRHAQDYYRNFAPGVGSALQELVKVDWLSVHRTPAPDRFRDDRSNYESAVDSRLGAISYDLLKYFASLSGQKDEEMRKFQEFIFISLLEQPADVDFFGPAAVRGVVDHRKSMGEIFRELRVVRQDIPELIASFFKRAEKLAARKPNDGFRIDDLSVLIGARKIDAVVKQWQRLQAEIDRVFEHRTAFVETINGLLQRKQIDISGSNELGFITRSGKRLTPQMLSSGEKQLLILLSETLLQMQMPAIFIADEPELSLHVTWQEKLIPSLRRLNPRSQFIAATHSPDIVGPLASHAIDMETLIP